MVEHSFSNIDELQVRFKEEMAEITDLNILKEYYSKELAKRDKLILELQEQNRLILQSAFRAKKDVM